MKTERIFLKRHAASFRDATDVETVDVPALGANDVLIRNRYAGINGLFDTVCAAGDVPYRQIDPGSSLGIESTGTVEDIGSMVTRLRPGDAVSSTTFGEAYRLHSVQDEVRVRRIDAATAEACAIRPTGTSAWVALHRVGDIKRGDYVAIVAAAGGLGHFAVQVAKRAGAHVLAICGGAKKAAFVKSLRADRVVDYKAESLTDVLAAEYKSGLDIVMETTGGSLRPVLLDCIARRGRFLLCGSANSINPKEGVPPLDALRQIYWKSASIRAFQNVHFRENDAEAADELYGAFARNEITVRIDDRRFEGLAAIPDAVEHLLSGDSMGKVVVSL